MTPEDDPERVRLARIALGLLVEPGSKDLGDTVAAVGVVEALRLLVAGQVPGRICAAAAPRLAGTALTSSQVDFSASSGARPASGSATSAVRDRSR